MLLLLWNVCLFYNQFIEEIYRPAINTYFNYLNEDITILHDNIDLYINKYLSNKLLKFEGSLKIECYISSKDLLKELNLDKKEMHTVSIAGRYDIYNISDDETNRN